MATTYHDAIQKLYVAYFNRPADFAGLNYWETVVEAANGDTAAVSAAFAASAEYKAEYDQLTNAGVVTQVYTNLFGHAPDAAGLAFWVNALNTKAMTIDGVVTEIAKGAQGTDKVAFESKVVVASAFTAALDTPAEQAGYTGAMANDAAKELLSGITTAAHATAAVVPATLNAHVAAVIKAGVPFSLTAALNDLVAAQDAKADFLAAADGDDDEDTSATETDLTDAVADIQADIALEVGADYATATPGVKAAMLADAVKARNDALVAAQKTFTGATADVAEVPGLAAAIANLTNATTAATAAAKAVTAAQGTLNGAVATYNTVNGPDVTVAADGTATIFVPATATAPEMTLNAIILAGTPSKLTINPELTTAQKTAVTAVFTASVALEAAEVASTKAATAKTAAQVALNRTDYDAAAAGEELQAVADAMTIVKLADDTLPTAAQISTEMSALVAVKAAAQAAVDAAEGAPTAEQTTALTNATNAVNAFEGVVAAFDAADTTNPLSAALTAAEALVKAKTADVKELADLIADLAEAKAVVAEMTALDDAIEAAAGVFEENDFAQPITVAGVIGAGLGSDIYVAGENDATIVAFGTSGDDMLFIGTDFTLNRGDIDEDGNNAVLEVFLTQSGSDTIISMETAAFGSNSAEAEVTITLTGVNVADVSLANGIITVA